MSLFESIYGLVFTPASLSEETEEDETEEVTKEEESDVCELRISMFEPRRKEEVKQIISFMMQGNNAAFVNLQRLGNEDAGRVRDYLCGASMALSGEVRIVDENVILCSSKELYHFG